MFIYNVTYGIDPTVEKDWIDWMKTYHIPFVMNTGLFSSHKFFRVLHDNEDGTSSYCIQYLTETIQQVEQYLNLHAPALIKRHHEKFKDKHVAFRTLLEEI